MCCSSLIDGVGQGWKWITYLKLDDSLQGWVKSRLFDARMIGLFMFIVLYSVS